MTTLRGFRINCSSGICRRGCRSRASSFRGRLCRFRRHLGIDRKPDQKSLRLEEMASAAEERRLNSGAFYLLAPEELMWSTIFHRDQSATTRSHR